MKTLAECKVIARCSDPDWVGEELFRLQQRNTTSHVVVLDPSSHDVDSNGWYHVGIINCDLCDYPAEHFHPHGGARCKNCVRP